MDNKFLKFLPILISMQIAIMTTPALAASASKHRGGFGDPCSKTNKCKSQSWLVCNPETSECGCAKPDEMIYDSVREKCVGIIGERCKYGFAFDDESLGSFYEKVDCVDGAKCESSDGICICPTGTYEVVEENKCFPVKPKGSECQLTIECNHTLICLNGECDCASRTMVFELLSGTCRIKAGEFCLLSSGLNILEDVSNGSSTNCVNGSECIDGMCRCVVGMYMSSGVCILRKGLESKCNSDDECDDSKMLSCINGNCVCRAGYTKNSKGLCSLAFGQQCSKENLCSDEFFCTQHDMGIEFGNGQRLQSTQCLCPNVELQFYDGNGCKGVVGGPCKPEINCTQNAHCVSFSDGSYGVCNCQEGFVEFDRTNCDVAYGYICEPIYGVPCDRLGGLLCKQQPGESEFYCRCPNEHDMFDSNSRKCLRKSYFTCKKHNDCRNNRCILKHSTDSSGRCA